MSEQTVGQAFIGFDMKIFSICRALEMSRLLVGLL